MIKQPTVMISINTAWNIFHFRGSLIAALKAAGYGVFSAAPPDAHRDRLVAIVDAHDDVPMHNDGTSPLQDMWLFFRYLRVLRKRRPSVLLTYTVKPNIYGALAARLLGIPVIVNVSGLGTAFIRRNWLTQVVKALYWLAFRGAACVFFQNAQDRDLFLAMRLVTHEKARLLNGSGIDLQVFHPSFNPPPATPAPRCFLMVARLLRDKGVGEYVQAARAVRAQQPDVVCWLVGPLGIANKTAVTNAELEGWVRAGAIEYLGASEDVRSIMAISDCVVLPSYREGLSRVLLEAAAMGKPMITTDVPGCRQVVSDGVNGFLCAPRDAESLADSMRKFLALTPEARVAMGVESRRKAEREFDERQVHTAYLAEIAAVI